MLHVTEQFKSFKMTPLSTAHVILACDTQVGWCLTALSAQKGYIMPCEK